MNADPVRIEAELLIPGEGDPIENGCVLLEGPRVAWVGETSAAPETGGDVPVWRVPTVMPGMWDCHVHMTGLTRADLDDTMRVPIPVAAARAAHDAERALDAGFTSVREMGGVGIWVGRVIDEGTLRGPKVYAAGDLISPTGGHADLHEFPLTCMADLADRYGWLHLCDGEAECLRAVRLQLRRGARVIKICASGGVLTKYDDPHHQQFSDHELRTFVEEAARAERVVAAHCHGKAGIMAALRAGVKTIEHGTWMDDEAAAAMKAADAILVTTRFVKERSYLAGQAGALPDYAWEKLQQTVEQHRRAVALAIRSGVTIAAGTDSITTGPDTPLPWGRHAEELSLLVKAGMTPLQAIASATAVAPRTLGPQAPRSGQLRAGYDADVIAVDGNPAQDVDILSDTDRVTHVWKAVLLEKAPRATP